MHGERCMGSLFSLSMHLTYHLYLIEPNRFEPLLHKPSLLTKLLPFAGGRPKSSALFFPKPKPKEPKQPQPPPKQPQEPKEPKATTKEPKQPTKETKKTTTTKRPKILTQIRDKKTTTPKVLIQIVYKKTTTHKVLIQIRNKKN